MPIKVRPNIAAISAYAPPWTHLDRTQFVRLDLNENTLPAPSEVVRALKKAADSGTIQMYPDYAGFLERLSRFLGVDPKQLIITNGSDQGLDIILRAFLAPGDGMVVARPEFPIFAQFASVIGAEIQGVPYTAALEFPAEAFIERIDAATRLIVLINPNNPTGTPVDMAEIERILIRFPDLPVLVDEAYHEFTGVTALPLLADYPNLIIARTFSKAFAMAGLRLGYVIAHPQLIGEFHKIRGPFDVNVCALYAAAAQMDHPDGWRAYIDEVMTRSKPFVETFFRERGVRHFPGAANFMLVAPTDRDRAVARLKEQGILVRPMFPEAIKDCFRLSIGPLEQMERFVEAFDRI